MPVAAGSTGFLSGPKRFDLLSPELKMMALAFYMLRILLRQLAKAARTRARGRIGCQINGEEHVRATRMGWNVLGGEGDGD
jgi:hypothetical protein